MIIAVLVAAALIVASGAHRLRRPRGALAADATADFAADTSRLTAVP